MVSCINDWAVSAVIPLKACYSCYDYDYASTVTSMNFHRLILTSLIKFNEKIVY